MKVRKLDIGEMIGFDYYLCNLYIAMAFKDKKLTTMEAKVLAAFIEGQDLLGREGFDEVVRRFVKEKLGLSRQALSNYERYLKHKGYIVKDSEGKWKIDPFVVPNREAQGYLLTLRRLTNSNSEGKTTI